MRRFFGFHSEEYEGDQYLEEVSGFEDALARNQIAPRSSQQINTLMIVDDDAPPVFAHLRFQRMINEHPRGETILPYWSMGGEGVLPIYVHPAEHVLDYEVPIPDGMALEYGDSGWRLVDAPKFEGIATGLAWGR